MFPRAAEKICALRFIHQTRWVGSLLKSRGTLQEGSLGMAGLHCNRPLGIPNRPLGIPNRPLGIPN
jgi:hypothetical protein